MRLRLREILGSERVQAVERAARWGFPRPVLIDELLTGHWFEWGPQSLFWLVPDEQAGRLELAVHVAVEPGAWISREARAWQAVLETLGDLLHAEAIYAWPIAGSPSGRAVSRLLQALGWTRTGPRWYLWLGGESRGQGQDAGQDQDAADARSA